MAGSTIIKRLTKDDYPAFEELDNTSFSGDEMSKDSFDYSLSEPGFVGLFSGNILIGYLLVRVYDSYVHLARIAIAPNYRGQGLSHRLMQYAITFAQNLDAQEIALYVKSDNKVAINLYQFYEFTIEFQSWHYIINLPKFLTQDFSGRDDNYQLAEFDKDQFPELKRQFPSLNFKQLRIWKKEANSGETSNQFPILMNQEDEIVVFSRFNANFSGCMPFVYKDLAQVDQFIYLLAKNYILNDRDYLRLTFDRSKELADRFDQWHYKQHHHLYKMHRRLQ